MRNRKLRLDARERRRRDLPVPSRPYRGAVVIHGTLALLIVAMTVLTGGDTGQALVVAALYFSVATAYSWWRFRQRLQRAAREGESTP